MKTIIPFLFLVAAVAGLNAQDIEGSKDHTLFPRITGFSILDYSVLNFAVHNFCDENGENMQVEGMVTSFYYECDCDIDPKKIINTLGGIVTGMGGKVYGDGPNQRWMVLQKDNKLIWVDLFAEDFYYTLTIIEKGEIISEITAESLLEDLTSKGKSIIYLNFDRDMCLIKDECKPVVSLIAEALKGSPDLSISIVGYTDDIGRSDDNLILSANRAAALASALIEEGIDVSRLETKGSGEDNSIASNETVEGRALNNRIEIIKK